MKSLIHFVLDALIVTACCALLVLCFFVWREAIREFITAFHL